MKKIITISFVFIAIFILSGFINTKQANARFVMPDNVAGGDLISIVYPDIALIANKVKVQNIEITNWTKKSDNWIEFILPIDVNPGLSFVEVYRIGGVFVVSDVLHIYSKPIINSITPQAIIPDRSMVTISGRNFGNTFGLLKIGSQNIPSISVDKWTDTEISFLARSYMLAGALSLQSYDSKNVIWSEWVDGGNFYIQPTITSLSKNSGIGGDIVTINGNNLNNNFPSTLDGSKTFIRVNFGNVSANIIPESWTRSSVSIIVPEEAVTGNIEIEIYSDKYTTLTADGPKFTILEKISSDTYSHLQTYLKQINVTQAWDYSHGRSEVIVAVIDDGVYAGHPDLDSNMWINFNEIEGNGKDDDNNGYIDDRWGWDFVNYSKNMTTLGTHGTMVAGIIGSESNNNAGITGINWNVKLMPIIACDDNGCNDEAIKKAIKYAADNGADIINLSLGGDVFNYSDNYNEVIKYAFDKNILVVVAVGNGDIEGGIGRNLDIAKVSPACNDGSQNMVLGVGAIDGNNQLTSWSNYGGCADIYAPGENIVSTAVPAHSTLNGFYDSADGTSFSTPIISGIAALIKAKYPTIKNTAIRDRIINNSDYQNSRRIVNAYKAISQTFNDNEKFSNNVPATIPIPQNINNNSIAADNNTVQQEKNLITKIDNNLSKRMNGKILLQVEKNGEGWYVYPDNKKKYYLGRPADAFGIMRNLGLGIKHSELENYLKTKFPSRLSGKIVLDVEQNGEAYYVNPDDLKGYYLGRPSDAFKIMRELGLGITNSDIRKIDVGEIK